MPVLEVLILAIAAIVVGGIFTFYGYRAFFILLPLFGFVWGFIAGGELISALFGDGLFATVTGWVAGAVVGLFVAVISYFWYYAAVVVLGAAVGWSLGVGFADWLGITSPLLVFLAGAAVGAVLAVAMIVADAPAALAIVLTAVGGAAYAVAGVWMLFGQIGTKELTNGGAVGALLDKPVAIVAWIGVAVAGVLWQYFEMRRTKVEIDRARYRYA
ncbi:MAG: DUF4203 domain-containing protein [Chloroflexota bacterium]